MSDRKESDATSVAFSPTVDHLLSRFSPGTPPKRSAGAAVLIVLREGTSDVEVLLIERTVRPDDPASGQVALPGGHVDAEDADLTAAVLRELSEEVGLSSADLRGPPVYVSTETAAIFGLQVAVFAAELAHGGAGPRVHSRHEVAHVFWLPRSALEEPARVPRETHRGAMEVDATLCGSHVLWGFTRRVLLDFFELAPGPRGAPRP